MHNSILLQQATVVFVFALGASANCGCSSDERPARNNGLARDARAGDAASAAGSSAIGDSGGGNEGGMVASDATLPEAGPGVGSVGDVAVVPGAPIVPKEPICERNADWLEGSALVELGSDGQQVLLSITANERHIAWYESASPLRLFVASRASADDLFAIAQEVPLAPGYDITLGAALSPDGLRLIMVEADGAGLGQLARDDVAQPFELLQQVPGFEGSLDAALPGDSGVDSGALNGSPDGGAPVIGAESDSALADSAPIQYLDNGPFLGSNLVAGQTSLRFAAPELSADGRQLYFTEFAAYPGDSGSLVALHSDVAALTLSGSMWGGAESGLGADLLAQGTKLKVVTGISADLLTLFYWDEAAEQQYAISRDAEGLEFHDPVQLGDYRGAVPNAACTRLYFTRGGQLLSAALE